MAAFASLAPLGHLEARQSRRSTTAGSAFYLDGPHCSASPAGFSRAISLSIALLSSPGAGLILMLLMPHAPAQHPHPLLRGYRVHTLICRGSGLPLFFCCLPPTFMMLPLRSHCWHRRCICIPSAHFSSVQLLPIEA